MELSETNLMELSSENPSSLRIYLNLSQAGHNLLSLEDMLSVTNIKLLIMLLIDLANSRSNLSLKMVLLRNHLMFTISKTEES